MSEIEDAIAAEMEATPDLANPEPEPEPTPEPEPEPTPTPEPEPASDVAHERRAKEAESSFKSHTTKITRIYEEEAQFLAPCPLCPDQHKGFIDLRFAGRVPREIMEVVGEYMGFSAEQEYEPDPDTTECPTCKGKGRLGLPGSVAGNETKQCGKCQGFGYVPPPTATANGGTAGEVMHFPAGERPEPVATEAVDLSGEPRILPDGRPNPNFGMWPQYKVPVAPWGITAGLTAQSPTAGGE